MKRYIRSAINLNVDLDEMDYRMLLDLADDSADPKLLHAILDKEPDNDFIKGLIAANPRAPKDLVMVLMQEGHPKDPDTRYTLAENTTNPEILTILADTSDVDTRQNVLTNVHTPIDVIVRLLNDGTPYATYAFNLAALRRQEELPDEELIKLYKSDKIGGGCKSVVLNKIIARGLGDLV